MLKYALLGFLSYQPLTGYALETHIRSSTAHFWHARLSQVYMTLKELEAAGWVQSEVAPQEKRPDRRVYSLTDAGRAALADWQNQPLMERTLPKDPLLLKIFFSAPAGKSALLHQLRLQHELHLRQRAMYEDDLPDIARDLVAQQPHLRADAVLWAAVRDFGVRYEQLYLTWLEETMRTIEEQFPETS